MMFEGEMLESIIRAAVRRSMRVREKEKERYIIE